MPTAGAQPNKLKKGFAHHKDQTEVHIARLEAVFEIINKPVKGVKCDAIEGILKEGESVVAYFAGSPAGDAAIIAAAQAVEHYEITQYGTLSRRAKVLKPPNAQYLLEETLVEEAKTDEDLNSLADSYANKLAA